MNATQIQTMLAPVVAGAAAWLAAQFPLVDQATWNALVTAIAMAAVTAFIGFITKKSSLANTVAPPHGPTVIVTDSKTAAALPANPNVVSSTDMKVVSK